MSIFKNDYEMTIWQDHIVDVITKEVIQEGTRFIASRANNMEEGIFNLYAWLEWYQKEFDRLRLQMEMMGRAPINNGTFFDPIADGGTVKALTLLQELEISQTGLSVNDTEITVEDGSKFEIGMYVSIFDDVNDEIAEIEGIDDNVLTVTALTNDYKRGAYVLRSNAIIGYDKMLYGNWGRYNIQVQEVI